jgi:hypothetical protein
MSALPDVDELCAAAGGLAVSALSDIDGLCAAAGGLELDGEDGDCAIAPDNISAPIAAPSINCFVMVRLLVCAMEPCARNTRWNLRFRLGGPSARCWLNRSVNFSFLKNVADEGRAICIAVGPALSAARAPEPSLRQ